MELHLFSTPGVDDIRYIVEASRPFLEWKSSAIVGYLPLASLYAEKWLAATVKSFKGLARVEMIDAENMPLTEMEAILKRSSLIYIPGGNAFLLSHRLHISGLMPSLKKRVQGGLPVMAFSAGTILCGPNILTSKDMNSVETAHFAGLNMTPFNFFVHYAQDGYLRAIHDEWLAEYHVFHDNPVVILADGAYIKVEGRKTSLVRGEAWILRKGHEQELLEPGALTAP